MHPNTKLARLRGELDHVDDQLLQLIEHRLSLCGAIRDAKGRANALMLRPKRQEVLVKRLQAQASVATPDVVRHIWRELIAHSLQAQGCTKLLLVEGANNDRLLRLTRDRFGSAAPVEWVKTTTLALRKARHEDAIAVVPHELAFSLPSDIRIFDSISDEAGAPVASVMARIAEEDVELDSHAAGNNRVWHPTSWRHQPALQLPAYRDKRLLESVERRLAQRAPIVELHDVDRLTEHLANVSEGKAIIIHGGDCAETFAKQSQSQTSAIVDLLGRMAALVEASSACAVVRVGRIAGQFAKPRTVLTELVGGMMVPSYRGDAVNDRQPHPAKRQADPERLIQAYDYSARTARWLSERVPDGLDPIYTSHEALLLNYEQSLTRYDELTGRWWAGSGHLLWIGNRTRSTTGAHVEYARGIANPIAVKCGPDLCTEELLHLLEALDSAHQPGRLTLIPRMGRQEIGRKLPSLMRAVAREGWQVVWCVDPMHGNTQAYGSLKTRLFDDIAAEVVSFNEICVAEGVWPGGMHLELTPDDVSECIGGRRGISPEDLPRRYETACDPRLNGDQALELAELIAAQHAARSFDAGASK